MGARKVPQERNEQAVAIVLDNPARYPGLPLLWAEIWAKQHGLAPKPAVPAERTKPDDV